MPERSRPIKTAATRPEAAAPAASGAASKSRKDDAQQTALRDAVIEMARLMAETRCSNVRVLDLRGVSPMCDYFILGTGTSARQMKSVADEITELAETRGLKSYGQAGTGENWIALDLIDVVVHLFSHEGRIYYDLDNLWGEATDVQWKS